VRPRTSSSRSARSRSPISPGCWSHSPSFRGARQREPGISRFPDVQLHIVVRRGACHRAGRRLGPLASPRNDDRDRGQPKKVEINPMHSRVCGLAAGQTTRGCRSAPNRVRQRTTKASSPRTPGPNGRFRSRTSPGCGSSPSFRGARKASEPGISTTPLISRFRVRADARPGMTAPVARTVFRAPRVVQRPELNLRKILHGRQPFCGSHVAGCSAKLAARPHTAKSVPGG
jgi:hypothetical protein